MLEPPRVVTSPNLVAVCEGLRGAAHDPVRIEINPNSWTDCPQCSTRFEIDPFGPDGEIHPHTPLDELGPPEFVEIEPIHTCNLRCTMCHVSYEPMSKVRLDPKFVDKLTGMEGRWAIVGSEYEPMAHPQIVQILQGLHTQGMKLDLTTNGTLFTPRVIDQIAHLNFKRVTISFDGVRKETFERIRRRANYEQTMQRVLAFKERVLAHNPNCWFHINYTVLNENLAEVPESVDFWEGHGFDSIGFIPMVIRANDEYLHKQSPSNAMAALQAAIDEAARRVIDGRYRLVMGNTVSLQPTFAASVRRNISGAIVVSDNPNARLPRNPRPLFQNGSFPGMPFDCRSPYKAVRLSYDGSLRVCSKFSIGRIDEDRSLLDIWYGARASQIRASFAKRPAICTTCDYFRLCINATKIDYTKPENIMTVSSPDPATIVNIEGYKVVRWLEKFYLLPPGTPDFDPRFDDITPERRVVEFKNFPQMRALLNSLLTQLGQKPVPIAIDSHEIWYFGNGFFAIPKTDDKGLDVVIETSPERLITRLTGKQPALAAG